MVPNPIIATREVLSKARQFASEGDSERFRHHLWSNAEHIRKYLWSFELENAPSSFTEQYVNDALSRFLRTLEFVPLPPGPRILEIGSNPYFFHILLHQFFPACRIEGTNFFDHNVFSSDIGSMTQRIRSASFQEEYEFSSTLLNVETTPCYPFPDGSFNLVFFCETLEHLAINPLGTFGKLRRIIAQGGHLIVTLPNAVRLTNFALMLDGHNFFDVYSENGINGRHNREYTLAELTQLVAGNGFEIVRAETWDRFDYDRIDIWTADYCGRSVKVDRKKRELMKFLTREGGNTADRGDNLYVLARMNR